MAVPKTEIERRMGRFTETCQANGLKVTHQRMEVFRELASTEDHPDAETIYQSVSRRVPAISRDTVYRTLATLEEYGLVRKAIPKSVSTLGRVESSHVQLRGICSACARDKK
jgi:Fur family peroxide stress response transcriptional regulator